MITRISPGELDQLLIEKVGKSLSQIQKQEAEMRLLRDHIREMEASQAELVRKNNHLLSEARSDEVRHEEWSRFVDSVRVTLARVTSEKVAAVKAAEEYRVRLASLEQQLEIIKANVSAEALVGIEA